MKSIETIGKTVDEALNKALSELKVVKDNVDVDIIDEGSKGFFNLFGGKPAKIKVTVKENHIDDAKEFLKKILDNMSLEAVINIKETSNAVNISAFSFEFIIYSNPLDKRFSQYGSYQ